MRPLRRAAPSARALPVREVKLLAKVPEAVSADGAFEGYASLFGIADLGKDLVEPGAFAASLARRGVNGVKLLWQHDPAEPLGRWLSLVEDARGLMVRGCLNLAVARARDIHALMRDGAIDGLSIGFRVERARTDPRTGVRRLLAVDLWEISIVTFPMLPGARVSAVKANSCRLREEPMKLMRCHPVRTAARSDAVQTRDPRSLSKPAWVPCLRSSVARCSAHGMTARVADRASPGEITLAAAIRRAASLIETPERT